MMNTHPQGGVASRAQRPNAGIDVSKEHLDMRLEAMRLRMANDAAGWNELVAKLQAAHADLVVLEATGGYWRLRARRGLCTAPSQYLRRTSEPAT
jgi:transposase